MSLFSPCQAFELHTPGLLYTFRDSGCRSETSTSTQILLSSLSFDYSIIVPILIYSWLLLQSGYFSYSLRKGWHLLKRLKVRSGSSLHSFHGKSRTVTKWSFCTARLASCMSYLDVKSHADGGAGSKGVRPSQRPKHSRYCGNWLRNTEGGTFSSPNYPNTYPPNKECLYVLEGNQRHQTWWLQSLFLRILSLNRVSLC